MGAITRESVRKALLNGITADQVGTAPFFLSVGPGVAGGEIAVFLDRNPSAAQCLSNEWGGVQIQYGY